MLDRGAAGMPAAGSGGIGWPSGTMVTFFRITGHQRLVVSVSLHARDGLHDLDAGIVALAK